MGTNLAQSAVSANAEQRPQNADPAHCRISDDIEGMRDNFCTRAANVIGRQLTADELRALMSSDEVMDSVRFEVDKVLKKVASWNLQK